MFRKLSVSSLKANRLILCKILFEFVNPSFGLHIEENAYQTAHGPYGCLKRSSRRLLRMSHSHHVLCMESTLDKHPHIMDSVSKWKWHQPQMNQKGRLLILSSHSTSTSETKDNLGGEHTNKQTNQENISVGDQRTASNLSTLKQDKPAQQRHSLLQRGQHVQEFLNQK